MTAADTTAAAAVLRLLQRLDWSDTSLGGPRFQLAKARGLLSSHVDGLLDADQLAAVLDVLGQPRVAEPLWMARAGDWLDERAAKEGA